MPVQVYGPFTHRVIFIILKLMNIKLDHLKRYPFNPKDKLQAWDAADELILEEVKKYNIENLLILNDSFGAITSNLEHLNPTIYTDSFVSSKAIQINSNNINIQMDLDNIQDKFDLVLLKIPKNMSFLEDSLIHLTRLMKPNAKLICTVMIKHLPPTAFELINKYIGVTSTSLAKRKARLIFANLEKPQHELIYPKDINFPEWKTNITNHSNLFSRTKLDIGTRFFLENIPQTEVKTILDLGCANGLIGMKAKQINPNSKIIFSDESYMAIKSAKTNFKKSFDLNDAEFFWTNCYEGEDKPKIDLVLCNPPFHQGNTIGDFIALQMFKDAKSALNLGGTIRVIGNRHLGYHVKLKKIFGNSKVINQNKKFVIIESVKI